MHPLQPDAPRAELMRITGADASRFVQAQFASDSSELAVGQWQWSSWLDAQGRVQAFMQLAHRHDDEWMALLRGGSANALAARLRRYVLRAQVAIDIIAAATLCGGDALPAQLFAVTGDTLRFGLGERSLSVNDAHHDEDWLAADVRDGLPWLPDAALGTQLPPALGLYRLGAVSTSKGCYPGQEIVSRLHFRGGHKQHLHRFDLVGDWSPGQPILNGDATIGMVLTRAGDQALAALRDDALDCPTLPPHLSSYAS
ncbi:MAG TPA: folate-binding protein [Rhodanobacteraceae bacterium]|nr:folate-binding protein [Rhodanobacteraceae bacterium]